METLTIHIPADNKFPEVMNTFQLDNERPEALAFEEAYRRAFAPNTPINPPPQSTEASLGTLEN